MHYAQYLKRTLKYCRKEKLGRREKGETEDTRERRGGGGVGGVGACCSQALGGGGGESHDQQREKPVS